MVKVPSGFPQPCSFRAVSVSQAAGQIHPIGGFVPRQFLDFVLQGAQLPGDVSDRASVYVVHGDAQLPFGAVTTCAQRLVFCHLRDSDMPGQGRIRPMLDPADLSRRGLASWSDRPPSSGGLKPLGQPGTPMEYQRPSRGASISSRLSSAAIPAWHDVPEATTSIVVSRKSSADSEAAAECAALP